MPLIQSTPPFRPPWILRSAHIQTILPALFRHVSIQKPECERITTRDQDFLDLEWYRVNSSKLVIISHGLEGSSSSAYVRGMAKLLIAHNFDVCAWNFRGCSGEDNKLLAAYHSGFTEDLAFLVEYAVSKGYQSIDLIGFSVGGNITLKYLSDGSTPIPPQIHRAVAISSPIDLAASAEVLAQSKNRIYLSRFIRSLKFKIKRKSKRFPAQIDLTDIHSISRFEEFDRRYIAPLHGFRDEKDYYEQASSKRTLSQLALPTLLLSSLDDPFLSEESFPFAEAQRSSFLFFETTRYGGHVGFFNPIGAHSFFHEIRALEFILSA